MSEKNESNTNENQTGKPWVRQVSGKYESPLPKSCHQKGFRTLDEYLQNKFHYDIYELLTDNRLDSFELFEPLNFFHTLYDQICFIEINKSKPLFISKHLASLSITDEQFCFLVEKIFSYFDENQISDDQLNICFREIRKLLNAKSVKVNTSKKVTPGNSYDPEPAFSPTDLTFIPQKNKETIDTNKTLDNYLVNEFNYEIYDDLTEGGNKDTFDTPLDFFLLFDEQLGFVGDNISKPYTIIKNLKNLPINEKQLHCLLKYLHKLIKKVDNINPKEQSTVCWKLLEKEFNNLDRKLYSETENETTNNQNAENYFLFDFDLVKNYLRTLQSYKEKIRYLIEAKTEYEQKDKIADWDNPTFARKCDLEIEKINQLERLEVKENQSAGNQRIPPKEREGMNIERAFMFFHYLSENSNASKIQEKKHKAIELITGYRTSQLNKLPSRFKSDKAKIEENVEIDEKFFNDLKEVRKLFVLFGLTELVKLIDKDLGN